MQEAASSLAVPGSGCLEMRLCNSASRFLFQCSQEMRRWLEDCCTFSISKPEPFHALKQTQSYIADPVITLAGTNRGCKVNLSAGICWLLNVCLIMATSWKGQVWRLKILIDIICFFAGLFLLWKGLPTTKVQSSASRPESQVLLFISLKMPYLSSQTKMLCKGQSKMCFLQESQETSFPFYLQVSTAVLPLTTVQQFS